MENDVHFDSSDYDMEYTEIKAIETTAPPVLAIQELDKSIDKSSM